MQPKQYTPNGTVQHEVYNPVSLAVVNRFDLLVREDAPEVRDTMKVDKQGSGDVSEWEERSPKPSSAEPGDAKRQQKPTVQKPTARGTPPTASPKKCKAKQKHLELSDNVPTLGEVRSGLQLFTDRKIAEKIVHMRAQCEQVAEKRQLLGDDPTTVLPPAEHTEAHLTREEWKERRFWRRKHEMYRTELTFLLWEQSIRSDNAPEVQEA